MNAYQIDTAALIRALAAKAAREERDMDRLALRLLSSIKYIRRQIPDSQ